MQSAEAFGKSIGVQAACAALIVPRSSLYRARAPQGVRRSPKNSARALSQVEKIRVREELNSVRFQDRSPREVYATLLDEGRYLCSWRSMYRILDEHDEVRERRNQLRHPNYVKPELLATAPNQLWSWDITKLLGPSKWTYFYLYVILDVYSRYGVGWMIAERESAALAEELISQTCARQGIQRGQLTVHADRGSAMTSKPVALLLADLGVTKTHSRPHVSNDNPYSEAQFKTMKYRPDYPTRFGCLQDADAPGLPNSSIGTTANIITPDWRCLLLRMFTSIAQRMSCKNVKRCCKLRMKKIMKQIIEYNILNFSEWKDNTKFVNTFNKLIGGLELFYK